jgi:hypothetical protein
MKIIKADIDTIREWRVNSTHLVADDGTVERVLDPSLEASMTAVVRTARGKMKSQEQTVRVGKLQATIAVTITRTGRGNDEYTLETRVDGLRVVSGREIIAAQMLEQHGECQLRHPNGVILKVIRNPHASRPSFADSLKSAPNPQNCQCVTWGKPHPGVHYATCPYNRLAPPDEQAPEGPTDEELKTLPRHAFASLALTPGAPVISSRPDPKEVVKEADPLDSPDECRNGCLQWATPKGRQIEPGQHHPTCVFAMRWAQKTSKETPRWLVDLKTGQKVRPATDTEIGQADVAAQRTGSPIIHVDTTPYAVLVESDLGSGGTESELRSSEIFEKESSASQ